MTAFGILILHGGTKVGLRIRYSLPMTVVVVFDPTTTPPREKAFAVTRTHSLFRHFNNLLLALRASQRPCRKERLH